MFFFFFFFYQFELKQAYICQGDVLMAMEQFDAAGNSYSMALDLDPSIRRSKSFKVFIHFLIIADFMWLHIRYVVTA